MKINELEIGKLCTITLVVVSATARETRAKKNYLALEFFDGTDSIVGNFWDWSGKNIPDKNAILNVAAQVTEWQGVKQLNVKSLTTNTDLKLSDFMPNSGVNIEAVYNQAIAMLMNTEDPFLKALGLGVLGELKPLWLEAPSAVSIHHAYVAGTLIHSVSVTTIAMAMANVLPEANMSLVTVGALLHDLGKLYSYRINGVVCELTDEGLLYEHSFIGAEFVGNFAETHELIHSARDEIKLAMLRHIILSHSGRCEYGAAVPPSSVEAHIVHHADSVDAIVEQIRDTSKKATRGKWTNRIWALDNRPQLTPAYVQGIMAGDE